MAQLSTQDLAHLEEHFGAEELDPELAAHLCTSSNGDALIGHPLVHQPFYAPVHNKRLNKQLSYKKRAIADALDTRDWYTYIFLHERPYRAEAFSEISDRLDDVTYWQLLSRVWSDTENLWQWHGLARKLLTAKRSGREHLMDDDERTQLDSLPTEITIYRGHSPKNKRGWSWTVDQEQAVWFARRFSSVNGPACLTTGAAGKGEVIAFFASENEVVIDPNNVCMIRTETHV